MTDNNIYARQKKYISKVMEIFKRVHLLVPKNKESDIKNIAKKMRDDSRNSK